MSGSEPRVPIHKYLTYRMAQVQSKLNAQAARLVQKTVGLTLTQWRVIALIGASGRTRMSDIVREAALDKGLLSRNIKSLVEAGHVLSEQDEHDHRVYHLSLTESGRAVYLKALPVTQKRQDDLRALLSDEEEAVFRAVLEKLEAVLDNASDTGTKS